MAIFQKIPQFVLKSQDGLERVLNKKLLSFAKE